MRTQSGLKKRASPVHWSLLLIRGLKSPSACLPWIRPVTQRAPTFVGNRPRFCAHPLALAQLTPTLCSWLQLTPSQADLIPPAMRVGFSYHSAKENLLTLTAWLPRDEENRLPPAASHFIGVGSFVLNSKDEILVVREKTGPSAKLTDFWKLPGGLCDRQEDINQAAVRELKEECGIDSEFVCVASIQEVHHSSERAGPARLGTTDLYIVCVLKAKDENQKLVPCETEIADARWMPAKDVLALPFYAAQGSVFSHMFSHAYKVAAGKAPGLAVTRLKMGFLPTENNLFGVFGPGAAAKL